MILGCHLSISGGLEQAVARAEALNINALQIFSHNARSWKMSPLSPDDAKKFLERRQRAHIEYTVIHTIYLINLASPDKKIFSLSVQALKDEIQRAGELHIPHVNTHIGAHMGQGVEKGLERVVEALESCAGQPPGEERSDCEDSLGELRGRGHRAWGVVR
jgi:deoxyribonuclease-4